MIPAYYVEAEKKPCEHCGEGGQWNVVGPGEVALSTSYSDKEDADWIAGELNHAYEMGRSAK